MISILTDEHYEKILDLIEGTEREIKIISPFISISLAKILCDAKKNVASCSFITRLYLEDVINKANSLEAMELMLSSGIDVYAVKGLHTKLYLFDSDRAILGSANFTLRGMKKNLELSLALEEEPIIQDLNMYYDRLKDSAKKEGGLVTKEIIKEADKQLTELFGSKKSDKGIVTSAKMFGADIGLLPRNIQETDVLLKETQSAKRESSDVITKMFRDMDRYEQIYYDHNIWLKFVGTGESRVDSERDASVFSVPSNGGRMYLSNYPSKPSVKDGDEIYLAALTTDKSGKKQPVIFGRGILRGYKNGNEAPVTWIDEYPWMSRYPWYCVVDECEVLQTIFKNGVSLDSVLNQLGSDTYISSYGKNESPKDVSKKHYQKAHLRLSGNAKEYIDKRFDTLVEEYGSYNVKSI